MLTNRRQRPARRRCRRGEKRVAHRFGRAWQNVLWTHPWCREKRRRRIQEALQARKAQGLPLGRPSRLHLPDGTLTNLGAEVLGARKLGCSYKVIAEYFGLGKTTVIDHCRRFAESDS